MHGNRRVWNWTPWQWRSQGGGGAFGPCPPKAKHQGPTYMLPPKPKPGLLDPLGPLAELDFLSVSGPRRKKSGLYRTNPGPAGWTRKTNQGPARQIRARKTNQGPAGQIRDTERIRALQYESGPRRTDQGPERRIRAAFFFWSDSFYALKICAVCMQKIVFSCASALPVQMSFRLGFADKKCSFFTVKNFTEQKFQVHKNWEMGYFSDPEFRAHVTDHGPPERSRDHKPHIFFSGPNPRSF